MSHCSESRKGNEEWEELESKIESICCLLSEFISEGVNKL